MSEHVPPARPTADRVTVISADCHAGPAQMVDFRDFVERKDRGHFDDYLKRIDDFEHARSAAKPGDRSTQGGGGANVRNGGGLADPHERERYLDTDGIAAEVIFPQGSVPFAPYPAVAGAGPKMSFAPAPAVRNSGPMIYNRWLADFCSHQPHRHAGVAVVPIRDIPLAVSTVEWARSAGLSGGISLPPYIGDDPDVLPYNDRSYDVLWAACEANEMPLNLHGGAGQYYGSGPDALALIFAEVDWFSHRALWFLIFSGVLERFPALRLAITEQRTHWVAPLLAELDSIFHASQTSELRRHLRLQPSEYFARNCFIGASFMSRPECERRHEIGARRLMWGSDYPHCEGTWPWTAESLRWTFTGVDEDELRSMLGGNAAECYGFDLGHLDAIADRIGPSLEAIASPLGAIPAEEGVAGSWAFRQSGPWA